MRRSGAVVCFVAALLGLPVPARAQDLRLIEVGATVGYSLPAGSLERASSSSDVTFGLVDLGLDGAYRLHERWSLGSAIHYGVLLPKLCSSGSECWSSLGHDVRIGGLARLHAGPWGRFRPTIELEVGYEWLGTERVEEGVSSERTYRGWSSALRAQALFGLSPAVSIGPVFEVDAGFFTHRSLHAPGVDARGAADGPAAHAWLLGAFRVVVSW
jgi:hypothetical protein